MSKSTLAKRTCMLVNLDYLIDIKNLCKMAGEIKQQESPLDVIDRSLQCIDVPKDANVHVNHDSEVDSGNKTPEQITNDATSRPKRNAVKPSKFRTPCGTQKEKKELSSKDMDETLTSITWGEDEPCGICDSMGEDKDLVSWIQCSFCEMWCHGSCVNLQFDQDGAKGIVKFKCPPCQKELPESDGDSEIENSDLISKLDKVNLLLDQEKDEVKLLKKKEREIEERKITYHNKQ